MLPLCLDRAALCQFLRGKHRLAEVELNELPVQVVVAALSTQSSTMEKLNWICGGHVRTLIHTLHYEEYFDVCAMGSWTCTP